MIESSYGLPGIYSFEATFGLFSQKKSVKKVKTGVMIVIGIAIRRIPPNNNFYNEYLMFFSYDSRLILSKKKPFFWAFKKSSKRSYKRYSQ